jgi:5'-nucleotidase
VAGLRYTFDLAQKAGSRITKVETGNLTDGFVALEDNKTYKVVTNNFIAAGGDGFTSLKNAKGMRLDTYLPDYTVMTEYFQALKTIDAKVEGRITILNEPK